MTKQAAENLALGPPSFEEEDRIFLQERLRSSFATVSIMLTVVLGLLVLTQLIRGADVSAALAFLLHPTLVGLIPITAAYGGLWYWLRLSRVSLRGLAATDAVLFQGIMAIPLIPSLADHDFSSPGHAISVAALVAIVMARAMFIPSTWRRTVLLSLPAPLAVAVLQLYHGGSFADEGQPYPQRHYALLFVLNQIVLMCSIYFAAQASHLNFVLRRRSHEARRLGPYELRELIGAGAMGEVYRATHAMLKRPTAVKLLRLEITGARTLKRFEHEVQQTSRLTHPNTISIFDYGRTPEGVFYYAMELVAGEDLRAIVKRTGPMPPGRVIHVLTQACGALAEAHDKGIVHRDIKPDNLMLCQQGGEFDVLKVLDFGLAKDLGTQAPTLTIDETVIGSPETMAPEILGGEVTAQSDLYSLSVVGCFLLTGKPIFEVEGALGFIHAHQFDEPRPPSRHDPGVPRDLEAVLLRGLSKDPAARPSGVRGLRDELRACADASTWSQREAQAWWAVSKPEPE